jgi:hypothetical protein
LARIHRNRGLGDGQISEKSQQKDCALLRGKDVERADHRVTLENPL